MRCTYLRASRMQSERSNVRAASTCGEVPRRCFAQSEILSFFLSSSAFGMKFQYAIVFSAETKKQLRKLWRCRELIPLPLACEASSLPFQLHPSY